MSCELNKKQDFEAGCRHFCEKLRELSDDIKKINEVGTDEIYNVDKDDELKDELIFCIDHIKVPLIAPICYERLLLLDQSKYIELMGQYLESTVGLHKEERLYPIKLFISQSWADDVFEKSLDKFGKYVIPTVLNYNMLEEMKECHIDIYSIGFEETYDEQGVPTEQDDDINKTDGIVVETCFAIHKKYLVRCCKLDEKIKEDLDSKSDKMRCKSFLTELGIFEDNLGRVPA